jgi:hypothetical protein
MTTEGTACQLKYSGPSISIFKVKEIKPCEVVADSLGTCAVDAMAEMGT